MKKFRWWILFLVAAVLAILFVPGKPILYDDGGTVVRNALTYKIVDWKTAGYPSLEGRRVYIFPQNFKSLSELQDMEIKNGEWEPVNVHFRARIIELSDTYALVEPLEGEVERNSCDKISLGIGELEDIGAKVGDTVVITYNGEIMESYPARIHAISWAIAE